MKPICPICGQGHIERETWPEVFEYQGATLTAERTEEFCDECGTLLQSPSVIRENVRNKQREKNKHGGLLTGDEIYTFRNTYKLTQKLAAELFGGGPTAFAKYESDEIAHNIAMDRLLRLCEMRPGNILALAKIAQITLPAETISAVREDLEARIREIAKKAQIEIDRKNAQRRPKLQVIYTSDSRATGYGRCGDVVDFKSWNTEQAKEAA